MFPIAFGTVAELQASEQGISSHAMLLRRAAHDENRVGQRRGGQPCRQHARSRAVFSIRQVWHQRVARRRDGQFARCLAHLVRKAVRRGEGIDAKMSRRQTFAFMDEFAARNRSPDDPPTVVGTKNYARPLYRWPVPSRWWHVGRCGNARATSRAI
jgi:hypothetical protein